VKNKQVIAMALLLTAALGSFWVVMARAGSSKIDKAGRFFAAHRELFEEQVRNRHNALKPIEPTEAIPPQLLPSGITRVNVWNDRVLFYFESMCTDAIEAIAYTIVPDAFPIDTQGDRPEVVYEFNRIDRHWAVIVFDIE
jgi:hypothetical protein